MLHNIQPMPGRLFLILLLLVTTLTAAPAFAESIEFRPQKTWVFIVGTLEWKDSETFESFPKENRRDAQLVRFFRQKGLPSSRLVYLADTQATTARAKAAFSKMLDQTAPGDLLFFYFTGHGYQDDEGTETFFATYDASDDRPGWSVDAIVRTINQKFRGDRVVLAADSCHSGALVNRVRRLQTSKSFACFSSSTSKQTSTANWTFTEMLLAGLRGQAFVDLNGDGGITLGEIARGVRDDMLFAEDQRSVSFFTGDLDANTRIAAATPKRDRNIGRRVEVMSEGEWYKARIIDAKNDQYRVRYYGYEVADDEWVGAEDIRSPR